MNNNFNNYNTNVDDYSDAELLNLLELDTFDHTTIINKIDYLNNNYFQNNKLLSNFFFAIKNRLLNINQNNISEHNISEDNISQDNISEDNISEDNNNEHNNEDNNTSIIENMTNINDLTRKINTNNNQTIENYYVKNYLYFNTLFRSFNNINILKTDSVFELSSKINNIMEIRLANINIKKPYLISNYKSNNMFKIKEHKNNNSIIIHNITISNGYYSEFNEIETFLNNNYFYNSNPNILDNSNDFLRSLYFRIDINTHQSIFDLCINYINNSTNNYSYFELDFNTDYVRYYSLGKILGFNITYSVISHTNIIISNFPVNNIDNNELFFCLNENEANIIETHKIFLNNNMSVFKVLAKINQSLANKDNNFYINQTYSKTNRYDNMRKYSGPVNFSKFNIKIIDYYSNLINQDINFDFTFILEATIKQSRFINN